MSNKLYVCFLNDPEKDWGPLKKGIQHSQPVCGALVVMSRGTEWSKLREHLDLVDARPLEVTDWKEKAYLEIRTEMRDLGRRNKDSEFVMDISTANNVQSCIAGRLATEFDAKIIYGANTENAVIEEMDPMPIPDVEKMNDAMMMILKLMARGGRYTTGLLETELGLKPKRVHDNIKNLEKLKLIRCDGKEDSPKRGAKSDVYVITPLGTSADAWYRSEGHRSRSMGGPAREPARASRGAVGSAPWSDLSAHG